jgi:hypothetical protein
MKCVMLCNPKCEEHFGGLEQQLRRARAPTPGIMADVIGEACTRLASQTPAARARLDRLVESGAWTEASLALVELELPQWKLRRLVYDDGEWLCTLSEQPRLPLGLDEVAEGSHEVMPLAILIALLEARRAAASSATDVSTVPRVRSLPGYTVGCDSFA